MARKKSEGFFSKPKKSAGYFLRPSGEKSEENCAQSSKNSGKNQKSGASRSFFLKRKPSFLSEHPALRTAFAAAFWLLLWEGAARLVGQEILLPAPEKVIARLGALLLDGAFWQAAGGSLLRVTAGFLLSVLLGTALAVLTWRFPLCAALLSPLRSVVKATPVASFIILALVWLRGNWVPVAISALMVLPVVWGNVEKGLREVDESLLEMTRIYRWSGKKTARLLYVPSVLPYFAAACGTGAGLSWKAGIAAEVIGRTAQSIGRQIYDSKIYLETVDLFAWTAALIVLSVLFERAFLLALRRLSGRANGGEEQP